MELWNFELWDVNTGYVNGLNELYCDLYELYCYFD